MLKFFRLLACAALIFSFGASCSAANVSISSDDIDSFMTKCNQALKAADPNSSLDTPKLISKRYADVVPISENLKATIVYTTRDDKLYSIQIVAEKYDENVKSFFEGMNIIFLKALGLTDAEAKALTNSGDETEWQCEGYISRLQKRFVSGVKGSTLTIVAKDK